MADDRNPVLNWEFENRVAWKDYQGHSCAEHFTRQEAEACLKAHLINCPVLDLPHFVKVRQMMDDLLSLKRWNDSSDLKQASG